MGLLLRPDAYYAETPDGAYVLTHHGPLALSGRTVHRLLDRLAPYLDGRHTLAELTANLAPERRAAVERLLTLLLDQGLVRDTGQTAPGGDLSEEPDEALERYRGEIAFIGYFRDAPERAFDRYRQTTALVLGAGRLPAAVALAAVRSGLQQVRLVATSESPTDLHGLDAAARRARRDPSQRLDVGTLEHATERAVESLLDGVGATFHVSDRPMVDRARLMERVCERAGVPLAQALAAGGTVWLSPLARGPSWTSGWRRRSARRPAEAGDVHGSGRGDGGKVVEPTVAAAEAVAGQLVHGAFRSITGTAEDDPDRLTSFDLSTLHTRPHAFRPHSFSRPARGPRTAEGFLKQVAALEGGARLDEERFSRDAATCTGAELGVLGEPTEREFAQLPLHVCEIEVSDPVGLLDQSPHRPAVTGAGLDFETARHHAALRALAMYAAAMADPRQMVTADGRPLPGADRDPDQALAAVRSGQLTGHVWGYGLADRTALLVDAASVFPALRQPVQPATPPPGVAAAYSWREAVEAGLVGQGHRLALRELAARDEPCPQLDLAGAALPFPADRYLRLLHAIGEPVVLYDLTGPLGLPAVACYLGATPAGCASGLTGTAAVQAALEQALLTHQSRTNDQPRYAPPPAPDFPPRRRDTARRPAAALPTLDVEGLAAALQQRGCQAVAVPLDHDPEVHAVMPYTVHVVLTDA